MFPPEVNYTSMVSGAGPAPMLAYGEALTAHSAAMTSVVGVSAATASATSAAFVGSAGTASTAAVVAHNTEHVAFAEETLVRAQIAHLAAAAHSATVARMVPSPPALANRLEEATDEQINPWVWGALTPRIVDLNTEYFGFMWPNNAGAGVSYGAALDGLGAALMMPSLPSVAGGSVAAGVVAAASLAEGAALSGMQAVVQVAGTGVSAVASPAAALPAAAMSAVSSMSSTSPVTSSAPAAQPMAAVQQAPSVPSQSFASAQAPAMSMFAPPPNAAVSPPSVPNPAAAEAPAAQMLTPRPVPPMPSAAPGVTSFVPPAEPFAPPSPTAGRASGLAPGMLNAAALRGPVAAMPLTTTAATSGLATATQPLAYVPPDVPRPIPSTPPQQPPLSNNGDIAHMLNPPPQPQQSPPLHNPPQQPAPGNGPPPGPSTGSGGPEGSGGPGTQTPGSGLGGAPLAPPPAAPLDTRPPPIPPPPSPGEPPLRPPSPPSWASPPVPKSVQAAQDQLKDLERLIQQHNSNPPDPSNWGAMADYNAEASYYNAWAAQLEGQLGSSSTQYTPSTPAQTAQTPSWTQPAPQQPVHQGPGSQPQPGAPPSPNLSQQAMQIAKEVEAVPQGSGQLQSLADKVSGLHLDQQQAAEVTDTAAKAAFGDTGGIANLPDGTKVVLPANILQRAAMIVHSDGSVTVFKGDLTQFLPYLGR